MKIRLGTLRKIVRGIVAEARTKHYFGGSQPEEGYSEELLDDPSYMEKSVFVPDDIKSKIDKWAVDMGLKTKKTDKKYAVHD